MKLNVIERLTLLQILPQEGNFLTLKVLRDLTSILAMTEKEFKEFDIKQVDEQVTWNLKGNEEKEVEIGEKATDLIVEALKELDKNKKLEQRHFSLYQKFVDR